jgi:hypothetical protein
MKKIILLIAIVFSLSANEIICKMSKDRYLSSYKLLEFAFERKNKFEVNWHGNNALRSLERVMVSCHLTEAQMKEAEAQRKVLINILGMLKKGK